MYICLIASVILLGFGIYGFVYTPTTPSEVMNTERSSSQTYNCDPSQPTYNPSVPCKTSEDCSDLCDGDSGAKCITSHYRDGNLMKPKSTCISNTESSHENCNAEKGGELILQPAAGGNAMEFGCQCRFPYYTSENPDSDTFCQLLPSICPGGNFEWDATKKSPDEVKCECPSGETAMNNINGKPTCVVNNKLGAGVKYENGKYTRLTSHSGVYPCVGDNNFC